MDDGQEQISIFEFSNLGYSRLRVRFSDESLGFWLINKFEWRIAATPQPVL